MHAKEKPPPLVQAKPDGNFPPGLELLVAKALSKRPEDRFTDMLEFRRAIQNVDPNHAIVQTSESEPVQKSSRKTVLASIATLIVVAAVALIIAQNLVKPHEPSRKELEEKKLQEHRVAAYQKNQKDINAIETNVILDELNLTGGGWNREEPTMIEGHEVTDEDFKKLKDLDKVRSFKVTMESKVSGTGFKYIPQAKFQSILIMSHLFDDEGAKYLSKIKTISRLCFHYDNLMTARGMQTLVDGLPEMRTLHLRFMRLKPGMIQALRGAKKLSTVDVGHSKGLGKNELRQLAEIKTIKALTLTNVGIDDEAIEILSSLPALSQMDINENRLTDEGLIIMARKMKNLRSLKTTVGEELTSLGLTRFKKLRPDVTVSIGEDGTNKLIQMLEQ
jgi:hypothetical protein